MVEIFYQNMSDLLAATLSWMSQITHFMVNNILLSFVFAIFIFRLLLGFYDKIKHIFH